MKVFDFLLKNFDFEYKGYSFSPTYWQAGAIIFLLFLLVLTLAQVRRHFLSWSVKGALFGLFFGFLLALILEGFLVIGGKTALSGVFGWKNPPKPVAKALDFGRDNLVKVLGSQKEIPLSIAGETKKASDIVEIYQSLIPEEQKKAKSIICTK